MSGIFWVGEGGEVVDVKWSLSLSSWSSIDNQLPPTLFAPPQPP